MEIKQLHYFSAIVRNDFNLSQASKELYISQPTLSVFINDFEKNEKVKLFKRKNGRLIGLTEKGSQYYLDSLKVIEVYDMMRENLHSKGEELNGVIRIGIPQVVNTALFSKILPTAIKENPKISFQLFEEGAHALSSKLLSNEIDIAVLLHPEPISDEFIEVYTITQSELVIAVSPNHQFASKKVIDWQDLHKKDMVSYDQTFMASHMFKNHCAFHQVNPNIIIESSSWDFLVEMAINNDDLFTLVPHSMGTLIQNKNVKLIKMRKAIPWHVTISRLRKKNYSKVENFVLEYFLRYFRSQGIDNQVLTNELPYS